MFSLYFQKALEDLCVNLLKGSHLRFSICGTGKVESETLVDPVQEPESLRLSLRKCDFKNKIWRRFGFQSLDPRTDFRAAGFFGLHQLDYFAKHH